MAIPRRVLLVLLFALTFLPLIHVGYTTNDESHVYFFYRFSWQRLPFELVNSFRLALLNFFQTTRPVPSLIITSPFFDLLSSSYHTVWLMRAISILGHGINIFLFRLILRKSLRSDTLADLGSVLFIVFLQNSWDHNLMTSYMPHVYIFSLMLASIAFFLTYLERRDPRLMFWSAVLYFFSLSYETNLVYLPLFIAIAAANDRARAIHHSRWFIGITGAWIAVYLAMRYANAPGMAELAAAANATNPDTTAGYAVAARPGRLRAAAEVILCHGLSSWPGFVFAYYRKFIHQHGAAQLEAMWCIKGALAAGLVYQLMGSLSKKEARPIAVGAGVLIGCYLLFAPGLPVSLIQKYQDWVRQGTLGFTNTYFSYFGAIFLCVAVLARIIHSLPKQIGAGSAAALVFSVSLATDYANAAFTLSQVQSQQKWLAVDEFIKTSDFGALPDGSIVYAPSLFSQIGIMKVFPPYWTDYLAFRAGDTYDILSRPDMLAAYAKNPRIIFEKPRKRRITIVGTPEELGALIDPAKPRRLYFIRFFQKKNELGRAILFGQATGLRPRGRDFFLFGRQARLFVNSRNKDFVVSGRAGPDLEIDGKKHPASADGWFAAAINKADQGRAPFQAVVRAKRLDLTSISITDYRYAP